ncbi:MAG: N-acetylmuramoyl-L-alanine amidase [Ruminococcus sp.]|jgi:N-acetylmuramoyl-L-alanine amidase
MEREMKKKAAEIVLGCLLLFGVYLLSQEGARLVSQTMSGRQTVVVDPGHGGRDPGKVGKGGVLEKDINLAIAEKVKDRLESEGIRVVMTRTEDIMLCDEDSENKKVQDMENRCALIDESQAVCVISIHQNSYSDETVEGPQVFYYQPSEEGRKLADLIQSTMNQQLEPASPREARGNESYYMLRKTGIPTVIVECGFLSSPDEAANLSASEYQEQVAAAVCAGVIEYLKK